MKLLVVEGNNKQTRNLRAKFGIKPYYLLFNNLLKEINSSAQITSVFPADNNSLLPSSQQIKDFDGVLWTGSSLSVLDQISDVERQLKFANEVFESGVSFYGSCWGLQVATIAAGGTVVKSSNGLELGVSKSIELTSQGIESPFFKGRKNSFHALCIHYDEVGKLPKDAVILAYNAHSKVQAITFTYKNSDFFGVQYHPEFRNSEMALIVSFLSKKLVNEGYYPTEETAQKYIIQMQRGNNLPKEIIKYQLHYQEIEAWLKSLRKN